MTLGGSNGVKTVFLFRHKFGNLLYSIGFRIRGNHAPCMFVYIMIWYIELDQKGSEGELAERGGGKTNELPFNESILIYIMLHDEITLIKWVSDDTHWDISTSWIVPMNRNSWRIRAVSWYLKIAYQSHNNKNDHLTRPREGMSI